MTTGSISGDSTQVVTGGWIGHKFSKTWNGPNQTPVTRRKDGWYVVRRHIQQPDGSYVFVDKIRKRRSDSPPPRRAQYDEHAYTCSFTRHTDELVKYDAGGIFIRPAISSFGANVWAPVSLLNANDQIKLVAKLRERIFGSDFNFAVALGESHKSLALIADSATRIYNAARLVKRGRLIDAARTLTLGTPVKVRSHTDVFGVRRNVSSQDSVRELSARWLELQYGWMPLVNDIYEGANFVAHAMSVPYRQVYRTKVRRESNFVKVTDLGGVNGKINGTSTRTHERYLKAILAEKPSNMVALSLGDPFTLIHELTPWSFIADWVIPLGDYFSSRQLVGGLTGTFITTDVLRGVRHRVSSPRLTPSAPRAEWISGSVTRAISTSLDVPLPTVKPIAKIASWTHAANAVALLKTAF